MSDGARSNVVSLTDRRRRGTGKQTTFGTMPNDAAITRGHFLSALIAIPDEAFLTGNESHSTQVVIGERWHMLFVMSSDWEGSDPAA